MKTFDLHDTEGSRAYYQANGYAVFRGLIPQNLCKAFIKEYKRLKGDRFFIFPTQSTYDVLPFLPDTSGYIPESVENPAFMVFRPRFAGRARDCLLNLQMAKGLEALDGAGRHVFWQSMFFDKSTGTPVHQDSLYLDTEPRGGLIGAWVALEDIHPDSGPFFVYPGTHRHAPFTDEMIPEFGNIHKYCQKIIDENDLAPLEMTINRGDVVFWHPSLIHGAMDNRDPSFSRKSLTAHFYPTDRSTIYEAVKKTPTCWVTPEFDMHRRNLYAYHLGAYARWAKRKIACKPALKSSDLKANVLK